ncbi:MAG: hypothetical protein ACR2NM_15035 [Bythopirellula sp.]
MLKKTLIVALLFGGFTVVSAAEANAWIVRRVAPVRRVVARTVLPPYPVARRVIARPVIRRRPVVYASPVIYPAPVVYGPTVSVGVGGYYGW